MNWEAWFTLGVLAFVLTALVRRWGPPDGVLMGGSLLCGLVGIITPAEVFSGFVNEGTLTIAVMFIVAAGVRETGALDSITHRVFGQARTETQGLVRMGLPVVGLSALFNNTPIVAMLLPAVNDWCRRFGISPSRMLMPLSYLAILGGTCTLIGTSTSLAINGLMVQTGHADLLNGMGLFELSRVGIPFTIVGVVYLMTAGRRLLPDRQDLIAQVEETPREFFADMQVQAGCRLVGQDIREAGLRNLPGMFLVELTRGETVLSPVAPQEVIREDDILTFSGVVSMIRDLDRIQGLVPVADEGYEARAAHRRGQSLCEVVISPRSPLIEKSIRDADFRSMYGAAVIAVHRGGERISGRIGDIVLRAGDTLLIQAGERFEQLHHNNPDFYLVSALDESRPVRHERAWLSTLLMLALIVLIMSGVEIVYSAFVVAGLMVMTRCVSAGTARKSIDWETIFTIAAAFGIGEALTKSGAAAGVADFFLGVMGGLGPYGMLAAVYIVTSLFAALISAKAAALLMFPIALSIALGVDASPRPFVLCVALSAAATFATPIGYPTNLMVYGPGGYRFTDFVRVGFPLDLILLVVAVILIPIAWPF